MKMFHASMLGGATLMLTACAVDPAMQAPPMPDLSTTEPAGIATVQPGQIAQCGHPGARTAELRYPAGWTERLARRLVNRVAGRARTRCL